MSRRGGARAPVQGQLEVALDGHPQRVGQDLLQERAVLAAFSGDCVQVVLGRQLGHKHARVRVQQQAIPCASTNGHTPAPSTATEGWPFVVLRARAAHAPCVEAPHRAASVSSRSRGAPECRRSSRKSECSAEPVRLMQGCALMSVERLPRAVCPGLRLAWHQPAQRGHKPELVQAGRLMHAMDSATAGCRLRTLGAGNVAHILQWHISALKSRVSRSAAPWEHK